MRRSGNFCQTDFFLNIARRISVCPPYENISKTETQNSKCGFILEVTAKSAKWVKFAPKVANKTLLQTD